MLTDIQVSSAKAKGKPYKLSKGKPYKLSDSGGLYLHVTANGARTWRYDYALVDKRYTVVLGAYPETSLKVARKRHLAARTAVGEGQRPLSPKQKVKADTVARTTAALHAEQNSFRAVAWNWYNSKAPHRSDSWRDLNKRYLERDLIKAFGDMPIEAVTVDDLREALMRSQQCRQKAPNACDRSPGKCFSMQSSITWARSTILRGSWQDCMKPLAL